MSYDLMLQTYQDQEVSPDAFDTMQQEIQRCETLRRPCEVTPGRLGPSPVDVVVLGEGLDLGDFSERDFADFCSRRGLPADRQHQGAAAAFVRSRFGFTVASFKLPTAEEAVRTAYAEIIRLALRHSLRVTDPQKGQNVDLQRPGLLPPGWRT
jgi:hypothetical protein